MAEAAALQPQSPPPPIDAKSGYRADTKTFHSLRTHAPLPPETLPISFTEFAFSLLPSPLPSNPAIIDASTGASLSYPHLLSRVRSLSSSLHSLYRLSPADTAIVVSPSTADIPVLYLSLLALGVAVCPINPLSTPPEISRQLALVTPFSIIFTTRSTVSKLYSVHHKKIVLLDSLYDLCLLQNRGVTVKVRQTDVAAVQFSSGTTGRVKAAALTHRSFIAMAAGFLPPPPRRRREVTLMLAPMFHSLGFFFSLKGLAMGETLVVAGAERPGLTAMLAAAERYEATVVTAAPPLVVAMARAEEVGRYDLGSLEAVLTGGAPMPAGAAREFMARFPRVRLLQGYGSTEAGGISRMIDDEAIHLRSVGRLTSHVEAKIVDIVTNKALSIGQQGELWVRGPAIMRGYVGDEEANASTFDPEGWLKTGDICYFDGEGFLHVVDRLKELIKYKAYQVPPAELENLLHSMPGVADAAVVPYPQEEVGQIPMAFVVKQPGSKLSAAQLMDFVAKQVAPYKKIRKVAFVGSIPKSAAGKILRRELASRAFCGSRL